MAAITLITVVKSALRAWENRTCRCCVTRCGQKSTGMTAVRQYVKNTLMRIDVSVCMNKASREVLHNVKKYILYNEKIDKMQK